MKLEEIFQKCLELSTRKEQDYTDQTDTHQNFKRSAELASWLKADQDKSYIVLIGTKLARLASLLDTDKPNFESVDDTFLDLINYCALWAERRMNEYKVVADISIHHEFCDLHPKNIKPGYVVKCNCGVGR